GTRQGGKGKRARAPWSTAGAAEAPPYRLLAHTACTFRAAPPPSRRAGTLANGLHWQRTETAVGIDKQPLAGVSVLLGEDDDDTRETLATWLEIHGARVQAARSAPEAVAAAHPGECEIVVSDIGLPGEDGFSLLRRLRALAGNRPVPAAAVTANADAHARL